MSFRRTRPFGDPGRPKVAGICRLFAESSTCKFGRRCKFSHDTSTNTRSTKDNVPQRTEHDDKIFQFKRRVNQGGRADRFSGGTSTQGIFALGLEILDNAQDAGLKQEVISTLASEEGLSCIRSLASTRMPLAMAGSTVVKLEIWETEVCPLLRLVVHHTVINSTLLEEKVASIHSFLIGVGASRMAAWFDLAVELAESSLDSSTVSRIGLIELTLEVLSILLDCGTTHIVNDSFARYAERLSAAIANIEPSRPEDDFCKMQAVQYSNFINRRLEIGQSIPGLGPASASAPVPISAFQLQRDLPGHLSADGPRHDNDHADIAKISILPTPNEIRSTRSEYLPTADPSTWHHPGIRGRLDREFRLLREDTVGQLRDVVRTELEHLQKTADHGTAHTSRPSRASKDSIQYCVYDNAIIMEVGFDRHTGTEFLVRFRQPAVGHAGAKSKEDMVKSENQRREWWTFQAKKRLQPGSLVCSINALGSVIFFTVTDSTMRTGGDDDVKRSRRNEKDAAQYRANINPEVDPEIKYTLADDPKHAFVRLGFSGVESKTQLEQALSWYLRCRINFKADADARDGSQFRILVEFPGILLASFLHTLQALQAGTKKLNIPFSELLAPDKDAADGQCRQYMTIPPPQYAQKPGFAFDMRCLATDKDPLEHSVDKPTTSQEVCERTKFDATQSTAILEALSRSMALVQGPPGTGKTFAGVGILEVLLHNQKKADLGPIVIVCYTNHALDQLLEHIVDSGAAKNVLRMGGQSKSDRLKSLNLRDAAMNMDRTKVEKNMLWKDGGRLKQSTTQLEQLFDKLGRSTNEHAVVNWLRIHHSKAYRELFKTDGPHGSDGDVDFSFDGDGFTTVIHGKPRDVIRRWRSGGGVGSGSPTAGTATDGGLFTLTKDARNAAYQLWQTESFTSVQDDVERFYEDYVAAKKSFDKTRKEVDLRCLKSANIVGMTTTGLAKNHDLLRHLNSKVLVCEEAGEVLEAHMLTSLLPSMQHAILIGDHQQLRPQVQNYDFSIESRRGAQFAFDTSLFERLVSPREGEPKIPFSKLSTQRRMHPSISALIRAPLYPSLEDGPNVHLYPQVTGMQRRLFWLDHEHLEDGAVSGKKSVELAGTSKTNKFEVEMTAALVSHLFKQGTYSGGDIAVLTPYLGQMMLLRRRLSSMFELSFNDRDAADLEVADAVGFGVDPTGTDISIAPADKHIVPAKTTLLNSVRVATVDNFQGEEAKVIVISLVRSNNNRECGFLRTSNRINVLLSRAKHGMYIIGNGDTCSGIPMWKDVVTALKTGDNMGPELPLQCPRHPEREFLASLPDHFVQFAPDGGCLQSCDKRLTCGHSCTGRCHSDVIHAAVKCLEPCPRPLKGCTHACPRPCGDRCVERCRVKLKGVALTLPCGHELKSPSCFEAQNPTLVRCEVDVKRTIPGCKHELTLPCHKESTGENFVCKTVCGQALPCGHSCGHQCSQCNSRKGGKIVRVNHGVCRKACGRLYGTCQHACAAECHEGTKCPPCTAPCHIRCSHSRCPRPCNEPCVPCAEEECASSCPHSKCTMPCAAPCNWIPCSKRCTKVLLCGHQCPSICGEQCPSDLFCQVCAEDTVLDQQVDFIVMSTYRDTDLNEDPCIFPVCGHILTMSSMDGIMDMAKHYTMENSASGLPYPVALAASSSPFDMKEVKVCPHCRGSLRDVARYGRIVRRAVLDESTKRFINWAREQHGTLAQKLMKHKSQLEDDKEGKIKPTDHRGTDDGNSVAKKSFGLKNRSNLIAEVLLSTAASRHQSLLATRNKIARFSAKVAGEEQPFRRVADLVQFARNRRAADSNGNPELTNTQFKFDESVIQIGSSLHAAVLLMRFDIHALECALHALDKLTSVDRMHAHIRGSSSFSPDATETSTAALQTVAKAFKTNRFAILLREFDATTAAAKSAKYTKQEAEGIICSAHLCIVLWKLAGCVGEDDSEAKDEESAAVTGPAGGASGSTDTSTSTSVSSVTTLSRTKLKELATKYVESARQLFDASPSSKELFGPEVDGLEAALTDLSSYQPVTVAEMQAVYKAMAAEFRGAGHWYTCANGHPFTVGECGRPMQLARCPECGAVVGGQRHLPAEGVVQATEIEQLGQDLGRLAVE